MGQKSENLIRKNQKRELVFREGDKKKIFRILSEGFMPFGEH